MFHIGRRAWAVGVVLMAVMMAVSGCKTRRAAVPAPAAPRVEIGVLADEAALTAWAQRELASAPSAVIGLVDRDGLRWWAGVGARDAAGGAPPDRDTVYRIGSITKVLTGTAVLQLRDAGKLGLDDSVATWIPTLKDRLGAVTVRHLITHTSGVPSVGDQSAPYWEAVPPSEAAMLRAIDVALEFPPGSQSAYSNAGMALAGVVVARAAGQSWRAYAAAHLLGPLGMRTAVWDRREVPAGRLAIGVGPTGTVDAPHWQLGAFEPAGGLYCSLDDMTSVARLALGAFPQVLAPTSLAAAVTDDPLPGPHGVAWVIGELEGARLIGHTGSTTDYSSSLMALPDRGLAVIVLGAGPGADRFDCVAAMLLRAAAGGGPPGSCVPASVAPEMAARATIAIDRLRALMAAPTDAGLDAVFTPEFLVAIPRAQILAVLTSLAAEAGPCARHELLGGTAEGLSGVLHCEKGPLSFRLGIEEAPPHRIAGLRF